MTRPNPNLTPERLEELARLAEAATLYTNREELGWMIDPDESTLILAPKQPNGWDGIAIANVRRHEDAEFIAAWNPETAKTLLGMLAEKDAGCGHENPLGEMLRAQELERQRDRALAEVTRLAKAVAAVEAVCDEMDACCGECRDQVIDVRRALASAADAPQPEETL